MADMKIHYRDDETRVEFNVKKVRDETGEYTVLKIRVGHDSVSFFSIPASEIARMHDMMTEFLTNQEAREGAA